MKTATPTDRPSRATIAQPAEAAKQSRDRVARVVRVVQERWEKRDFNPSPPSRQRVTKHRQ